jgi:hypothetical protein
MTALIVAKRIGKTDFYQLLNGLSVVIPHNDTLIKILKEQIINTHNVN